MDLNLLYFPSPGKESYELQLIRAVISHDLKKVSNLLKTGISLEGDEYNILKEIIFNQALLTVSKDPITPLHLAANKGYSDIVDLLIANGADVDADFSGITPLHFAAINGHFNCLKSLLRAGAKPSPQVKRCRWSLSIAAFFAVGSTPLHLASSQNHVDCVEELIQYGADCNAIDEFGYTSLHIAAQLGYSECIKIHLKNPGKKDFVSLPTLDTSDTPLHFAATRGLVECVRLLIKHGSDVNHVNYKGKSPLHCAMNFSYFNLHTRLDVLKILIQEGCNPNQVDGNRQSPLELLYMRYILDSNSTKTYLEMMKLLISYGADVEYRKTCLEILREELHIPSKDVTELLRYIVRSMLCLPNLEESLPLSKKYIWYKTLASNPRTLQHHCRIKIRKALGPHSMKQIYNLNIPPKLQSYLLLEYDE